MDWATLFAAAYSSWSKQRAAEAAQGSPALALAAQREGASSGQGWIVATGGSRVRATTTNQDVLPGLNALPMPDTTGTNPGELTLAGPGNTGALVVGAIALAWFLARK